MSAVSMIYDDDKNGGIVISGTPSQFVRPSKIAQQWNEANVRDIPSRAEITNQ